MVLIREQILMWILLEFVLGDGCMADERVSAARQSVAINLDPAIRRNKLLFLIKNNMECKICRYNLLLENGRVQIYRDHCVVAAVENCITQNELK